MNMFTFHHVSLSVRDISKSIKFYGLFGFKEVLTWRGDDNKVTVSHLKLGDMLLELFCFKNNQEPSKSSQELATDLPRIGVKHFGLKVENLKITKNKFLENGLAKEIQITQGKTGIDYFFIKDPDGILLEFLQDDRDFEKDE